MATRADGAWTVRPGRPDDVPGILELFRATFGKPASADWYEWKCQGSPVSFPAETTFVAVDGTRVVGHYGATAFRLRMEAREVTALQGADLMVPPELRRQGITTAVGRAAHRAWAEAGAQLVLGAVPNHWGGLVERLDYRPLFALRWLWRPLHRVLEPRGRRGVDVVPVETASPEVDAVWETLNGAYDALAVRSRAWLEYRYAAASERDYHILIARRGPRPAGYVVYRLMGDARQSSWIVDLLAEPPARRALLGAALRELRRAGAVDTRLFAARGTALWRDAIRLGFVPRRGSYDVSVVPLSGDLPWDTLRDAHRFFVTGGDFDVV